MTLYTWSKTAASNSTADASVNWAEGQAPSTVNNSARAMMAAAAKYRDDHAGALTTGGSSTAYTVTSNQVFDSLANMSGHSIRLKMHATNGAAATLDVDGLGAKAIVTVTGTAVGAGALLINAVYEFVYSNSSSEWILVGGTAAATGFASGTLMLFVQTAAPTGWTKNTSHNDKALRIVSGTAGTGGSAAFTTALASRTIAQGNLPNYTLPNTISASMGDPGGGGYFVRNDNTFFNNAEASASTNDNIPTGASGLHYTSVSVIIAGSVTSGGSGTAMDFAVAYVDCIIAAKD